MLCVTDCRISAEAMEYLKRQGYENVSLPPFSLLPKPVSSHPDMLIFIIDGTLITHSLYYKTAKAEIDFICRKKSFELCLSNEKIGAEYPLDVLFNACVLGNKLVCNLKAVSHLVLEKAEPGFEVINTRQGYAKCSVCKVSDNAIITSDENILHSLEGRGVNTLKISSGSIELSGYDYGFIGGASGNTGEKVYFCGDISTHPDCEKIVHFCAEHKKEVISLANGPLCDVGTIFLV